jgi:4-hydroxy-3-methylbut-2-enyl diphosphate reductase
LEEGQTRRGTVRSVTDFGAFVDLGGVDGLLHVSEMSWKRGQKPSDFVKLGDIVDVKIIKLDKASGKMSLSLKQAMADPWSGAETALRRRHHAHRPRHQGRTLRRLRRSEEGLRACCPSAK